MIYLNLKHTIVDTMFQCERYVYLFLHYDYPYSEKQNHFEIKEYRRVKIFKNKLYRQEITDGKTLIFDFAPNLLDKLRNLIGQKSMNTCITHIGVGDQKHGNGNLLMIHTIQE